MKKGPQSLINFQFPMIALAGGYLIYRNRESADLLELLYPTGLILVYAFLVRINLKTASENEADHYCDSIYFMGFLYTLMALATLFVSLNTYSDKSISSVVNGVFSLVGVSVTTSIAGVLFRNMVKSAYMKTHPEPEDSMNNSYLILKEIAASFNSSYSETFYSIQEFLQEREENLKIFNTAEGRYLQAIDQFVSVTESFSQDITRNSHTLNEMTSLIKQNYQAQIESTNALQGGVKNLLETMKRLNRECGALKVDSVADSFKALKEESGELNSVIDSMIEILDRKLERVPV